VRTEPGIPAGPPLTEARHRGLRYFLVAPRDLALRTEIRREDRPFLRLSGEDARGMLEAGGFLFVYGDRLWVLDDDGGMREVPLPFAVRWRRAWHRASGRFRTCTGGCLDVCGVLFTPAGPDPGWNQLPLP
jgi:hypothetical protein